MTETLHTERPTPVILYLVKSDPEHAPARFIPAGASNPPERNDWWHEQPYDKWVAYGRPERIEVA